MDSKKGTEMTIQYSDTVTTVQENSLKGGFFEGWPNPPSASTHLKILKGSSHCVLAIDDSSDEVVGFVTAVSDGVLTAYVPFLEVLTSYRKQGIASELVKRLFKKLENLYMIDLCCDDDLVPFYERFSMHQGNAMLLRNYSRQSGL